MIEQEVLVIKDEEQAWVALQEAMAGNISSGTKIVFDGWPVFKLRIQGEDFNGSIPTRIMPPILELQKEIHRIYCRAKYGTDSVQSLKQSEREQLELIVTVEKGSTNFITEMATALNDILENSNMDGQQTLVFLITIGVLTAGVIGWKNWLKNKEQEHNQQVTVALSKEETERLKIVTEAMKQQPELKKASQSVDMFRDDLSKRLKADDALSVTGQSIINGARAAEIVPAPRVAPLDVRMDGKFEINEVKFPKSFGGSYRFSITNVANQESFMVEASAGLLSEEQIVILKNNSFDIKPVYMEINAKRNRNGAILSASLVSIWLK